MAIILPKEEITLPKKAVQPCDCRGRSKPCDTPDTLWNPVRHPESSTSEASELPEERVVCKHDRAESVGWNTYQVGAACDAGGFWPDFCRVFGVREPRGVSSYSLTGGKRAQYCAAFLPRRQTAVPADKFKI